jgi:hypothetical protein
MAEERYKIVAPMQSVGKAHISVVTLPDEALEEDRYVYVADIHSHNSMPAVFSKMDDDDERATRVYVVVGLLDQNKPAISARVSVGGRYVPIDAGLVIDVPFESATPQGSRAFGGAYSYAQRFELEGDCDFPAEWSDAVNVVAPPSVETRQADVPMPVFSCRRFFRIWRMGERA